MGTKIRYLPEKQRILGVLSLDHFVNDFYSLFVPMFVPALVLHFGINYFKAGILVSTVSVVGALLQSPVGYWADVYKRRVMFITAGFFFFALGAIILGVSTGFIFLIIASFLIGLATATYHPQGANLITKHFARKGQALGIHGVGGQVGRFISPMLITFLISRLGWREAAAFLCLPAIAALSLSWLMLKEPAEKGEKGFAQAITLPIVLLVLILGIRGAVFQSIVSFFPSFLVESGSTIDIAGLLTGIMLGVGLLAQPLGGNLGDKVSKSKIIFFSLLGLTLLFFFLYLAVTRGGGSFFMSYGVLIPVLAGIGFCIFVTFPVGLALSAELTSGERVGSSIGIVFGGGLAISAATLPAVGHLIDTFGFGVGFGLLGALTLLATVISGFCLGPSKKG